MKSNIFNFQCVLLVSLLLANCSHGARILAFLATASRSHLIINEPLMMELAKRGHDVTVVTSFKQSSVESLKNYRHIEISDFLDDSALSSFSSEALQSTDNRYYVSKAFTLLHGLVGYSVKLMRHPKFLALKNEQFDLLVVGWYMNEYALGLSGHFHCPSVVISPNVNFYPIRKFSGNPSSVSTIPSILVGSNFEAGSKMTFLQRVLNLLAYVMECISFEFTFYFYSMPFYDEEFPPGRYPSYSDVLKNVSLVLVTQHFSSQTPEALLPNVIEVEGMHIKKKPSPLPAVCCLTTPLSEITKICLQDIEEFLDGATDGAIFFSLGSNVKSSELSREKIAMLLRKFQTLKQRVLWKFETELSSLPVNVKIGKWLPQDDVLAHPNVKLFISHCGKGGITEAKYHGVPILAIPVFGDQFSNAKQILNDGWAISLPLSDLNAATFTNVLDEALSNSTYSEVAKKLSRLYRDRAEHPLDRAVYWIEYVIRHNGAKHMQSPGVDFNMLQHYSIDVLAFISIVAWVLVKLVRILFNVFLFKVFGIRKQKVKKE